MAGTVRDGLYFRVLGPPAVECRGRDVDLGGPQHVVVLATLLANANRVVPVDALVDALWDGAAPRSYRAQLQGLVSALRKRLAAGAARSAAPIVTRAPGYLIEVPDDRLDLAEFLADVAAARRARADGDEATAIRLLRRGLDRWRGPGFAGVSSADVEHAAAAIDEARVVAVEDLIDAQLADGQLAGLSAELVGLVAQHPLRERFHGQLMTVYARTGRRADALLTYRQLRDRMVVELGIEPSEPLRQLQREVLGAADALAAAVPVGGASGGPAAVGGARAAIATAYRQLPPDVAGFVGRQVDLAAVLAAARPDAPTARLLVLDGMAGVGKTALAVRAAHRLADRYPDGQLYVDLRGFSPGGTQADSTGVLESFLRLLGVPAEKIPADEAARAAVLRDRVAGQRMLFLLDNAADEEQLRPLLAAGAGGLVLVTSRRRLALDGAWMHTVAPMRAAEATDLLTSIIGADRVAAEPEPVRQLVRRCGYLPLTVALAGQRLRARPDWPIAHLAARLADEDHLLDWLSLGHRSVETVFAMSYRALPEPARRLFRLAGVHPGGDFTAASAAAMACIEPATAELTLESLVDEHLLGQPVPGRYQLHDLLRVYAVRRCYADEPAVDRRAAVGRLLDWYVAAVEKATAPVRRFPVPDTGPAIAPVAPLPRVDSAADGLDWLDTERGNLLAAIEAAGAGGRHRHAMRLAFLLEAYFPRRGRYSDWLSSIREAERAAAAAGDPHAQAHAWASLGRACGYAGDVDAALGHLNHARDAHRRLGDREGEATDLDYLGVMHRQRGDYGSAARHHAAAIELLADAGNPARWAMATSNLSIALHLQGRGAEALNHAYRALEIQQTVGDPGGEASLRSNLGLLCARLGRYAEGAGHSRAALAAFRRRGSVIGEANALANLAYSYARLGREADALEHALRAVELGRRAGTPDIVANALNTLGEAHRLAGAYPAALTSHREALAAADRAGNEEERDRARRGLAEATKRRAAAPASPAEAGLSSDS